MCNHYRLNPENIPAWAEWAGFNLPPVQDLMTQAASDVFPKRQGLVVRAEAGAFMADAMQWGVPRTMAGKRPGTTVTKRITNVRNLDSPFWRSMLAAPARRCLVPFSRFAEPKPGTDPETGRPNEWWFTVTDRPIAAFAAIWRPTDEGNAYAFLTCEPNALVQPLHPKAMPVILQPEDYRRWLTDELDDLAQLATPFPSQLMAVA